jgi:threonine/homoserine/homoserine lactone efflux protein/catechol 2,3-dioxygenase-like lactoylglutathione lyase family enzyme
MSCRIVQDGVVGADYGPGMEQLAALVGFSFVSSVTPGPNNILLWASGASFGFRRTVPHVLGTALGIGAMVLLAAIAAGAILAAVPQLATAMKVAGSVYLLWLAVQIVRAGALERTDVARPFGIVSAAAFQLVNPKAWVFALGAVTTFRPTELPAAAGGAFVALTMMLVIVPTAALWAGAGDALSRFVSGPRARRVVSLVLAGLLIGTVALVWLPDLANANGRGGFATIVPPTWEDDEAGIANRHTIGGPMSFAAPRRYTSRSTIPAGHDTEARPMDYTLELIVVPVSDVDRAKAFYIEQAGFDLLIDSQMGPDFRVVQLAPKGSACAIAIGTGIGTMAPGSLHGLHLVVSDIEAARDDLVTRGTEVGEIFHFGEAGQTPGVDPERRSYATFMPFQDPDGNTWLVQEVKRDWRLEVVKVDGAAA